jgi:hypothetical protein
MDIDRGAQSLMQPGILTTQPTDIISVVEVLPIHSFRR